MQTSGPTGDDLAAAWDERVDRALAKAPGRLRRTVAWLRRPARRWLRIPAAALFMLGGLLAILPILGLWMLPLGLALLAEDVPVLKTWLESVARRGEVWWRRWRS